MNRMDRSRRRFAMALAGMAGFVDAAGYLSAGGYFVSFMSGNTTRLGVALGTGAGAASRAADRRIRRRGHGRGARRAACRALAQTGGSGPCRAAPAGRGRHARGALAWGHAGHAGSGDGRAQQHLPARRRSLGRAHLHDRRAGQDRARDRPVAAGAWAAGPGTGGRMGQLAAALGRIAGGRGTGGLVPDPPADGLPVDCRGLGHADGGLSLTLRAEG
jgi:hypothetical protein